jgi:threonine dehydratase
MIASMSDTPMVVTFGVSGVAAGIAVWRYVVTEQRRILGIEEEDNNELRTRLDRLESRISELEDANRSLLIENIHLRHQVSVLEARLGII